MPDAASIGATPGVNSSKIICPRTTWPDLNFSLTGFIVLPRLSIIARRLPIAIEFGAEQRAVQHVAVHDIWWRLAVVNRQGSSTANLTHVAEKLFGPANRMRSQDYVVQAEQRRIRGQRFSFKHVQRGAPDR